MKKIFLVVFLISIKPVLAQAQSESSFGAFMSTPVGATASTNIENGGFAKTGWGIVFDSKNKFKGLPKGLSLFLHSTYQWNKMDTEAIQEKFTEELQYRTEVSNSKYSPLLITAGPSYEIPLSEKFTFGVNATAGVLMNNTKAFTIKVYDQNNALLFNELINFEDKVAFAYTFGSELKYDLVPDVFGLSLYIDYTGASQKVEVTSPSISSSSFEKLQFFNSGLKLVFYGKQ